VEDQDPARIKEIKKNLSIRHGDSLGTGVLALKSRPLKYPSTQYERKVFSQIKENSNGFLQHKISQTLELGHLLLTTHSIYELSECLLRLFPFKQFESCHVLVHEKGKPVGDNYVYDHATFGNTKTISIQNFNSPYNLIKKSKNKIFTQSLTLKDDLDVVGNFLGKEIDLKNYSVICLISRNSFLSPSQAEQDDFYLVTSLLPPLLNKILNSEKNNHTLDLLIKALKVFPEKITVRDSQRVIFTNNLLSTPPTSTITTFALDNTNLLSLELSTMSKDQITAEIFHSQRIALLGELLNTLQHELSNPLFGLNLTAKLLQNESNTPESNLTLDEICQNAKRSQKIIKNFSHLYSDLPEEKQIKLYEFVEEVITLTKSETREIKKEIEAIGFSKEFDLGLAINPTYLSQILFNLIINAAQSIKATTSETSKNKIVIKMIKKPPLVEISVIDDGAGIPIHLFGNIFSPFFTTKASGTGLGLSICQNLAKKLHSEITFKNNSPFPGATFSIDLPLAPGVADVKLFKFYLTKILTV
jgi:signal transduction histidine kinase